jgi:septal ring factor EnvC (AmiA/AmiB activator)
VEEKTRDRDVWRRKVADLDQQLGSAQKEAQKAEHRLADAEEALALAERRLRAAQVSLAKKNSGSKG